MKDLKNVIVVKIAENFFYIKINILKVFFYWLCPIVLIIILSALGHPGAPVGPQSKRGWMDSSLIEAELLPLAAKETFKITQVCLVFNYLETSLWFKGGILSLFLVAGCWVAQVELGLHPRGWLDVGPNINKGIFDTNFFNCELMSYCLPLLWSSTKILEGQSLKWTLGLLCYLEGRGKK